MKGIEITMDKNTFDEITKIQDIVLMILINI